MADLSRTVGLHTSTAFHLLQTLVARGYLARELQTRKYRIGPRLLQVAATATSELYIAEAAAEVLDELTAETGETSSVAVLERDRAMILSKVDGPSRVGVIERPGDGRPLHCTAIGKVLFAGMPQAKSEGLIAGARLELFTERSITDAERLLEELATVRAKGYAVDNEEFSEGLRCIAAPVRSFSRQVVAALGVAAPIWRISPERVPELVRAVTEAAGRLSARLGYPSHYQENQGEAL
jgi:IclR family acetate operon transcriptional repressor